MIDPYVLALATGGAGLGLMALTGLSHGLPGGHHAGAHPHGTPHGTPPASVHPDGGAATAHGHAHGHDGAHAHGHAGAHGGMRNLVWTLLSPRVLFSVLVGFGLTGLLLRPLALGAFRLGAALAGGLLFEALLVAPLWRLLFRFGSRPALTLESCIADRVRAVTGFDAEGHGLVAVPLDGQLVQVLATLRPEERAAGVRVRAGDEVRIDSVDAARNRCTVTTR